MSGNAQDRSREDEAGLERGSAPELVGWPSSRFRQTRMRVPTRTIHRTDRISPIIAVFPEPVRDLVREVLRGERRDPMAIESVRGRTSEILFPPIPDRSEFEEKLRQTNERLARLRAKFRGGVEAT